ncbi:hypothetical protein GCK72_017030 [Caenorhabditis remanei]|uniref:Methyltransferase FkbM domain-containing protein n=1 Tax=Caenorhabditis remanei TaxID=31234 RepID=A0A6A5G661_CAERE|nr:hypothetical protein GCK72_017030 [Caenorhabditis remanei]KAF1750480.1 hypothetical protein GCK72_017030 [Caenorhabditis remanei]
MSRVSYVLLDGDSRLSSRSASKYLLVLLMLVALLFVVLPYIQDSTETTPSGEYVEEVALPLPAYIEPGSVSPVFEAFYNCVRPKLAPLAGSYEEFWFSFVNLTKECDDLEAYNAIDLRPAPNRDEVKHVAYPRKIDDLTMITFGIGHDVSAEIKLKEMYPTFEFYGVDPSSYINQNLYEKDLGGKYFEYAISGHGGMLNSRVFRKGGYREEVTKTIGADVFFAEIVQKKKIDVLWIDVEGHEYPILNQLHHNGALDKKGVVVCQINVEMHKDTFKEEQGETKKFHDFVWKVLEDRRYVMLKPVFVRYMAKRFIRTFIVNVADKECTDLFLS